MSVSNHPDNRTFMKKRQHGLRFGVVFLVLFGMAVWLLIQTVQDRPRIFTAHDPAMEITALAEAMNAYRSEHGEYPPSVILNEAALRTYLLKRFPGLAADEIVPPDLDPAEAIVFWLGGFSLNPEYPISGEGGPLNVNTERRAGLYAFDPQRLVLTSHGKQVYLPPGIGRTEPYVYFLTSNAAEQKYPLRNPRIMPYCQADGNFVNSDSFQILSAGEDDQWGDIPAPAYPAGPFLGGHKDNRSDFAPAELGSLKQ